jgi:hypothetical protein
VNTKILTYFQKLVKQSTNKPIRFACTHSSPLGLRATLTPRGGCLNFVQDPGFLPLFLGGSIRIASTTGAVCEASPVVPEASFV